MAYKFNDVWSYILLQRGISASGGILSGHCKIFDTYVIYLHTITEYCWKCVGCIMDATVAMCTGWPSKLYVKYSVWPTVWRMITRRNTGNMLGLHIFASPCPVLMYSYVRQMVSYSHVRQNSELFFQVFIHITILFKKLNLCTSLKTTGNHACVKYFLQINLFSKINAKICSIQMSKFPM